MLTLAVGVVSFFFLYQSRLLKEKMKTKALEIHYQREMVDAIIKSQEAERKKIAADIHDNLSGSLFLAQLNLVDIKESLLASGINQYNERFGNLYNLLEYTIDSTKQIARDLVPTSLAITGLSGSIRDYCGRIKISGLTISIEESGISGKIPYNIQLNVYRIIQELVSNALKHAGASQIRIALSWSPSLLTVDYFNDGQYFFFVPSFVPEVKGHGLLNIAGRLGILQAKIKDRRVDTGFNFIFDIGYE